MPRWNGGVIGAANNPTSSSAKGIWSLSEATKAIRAGLWPPSNAGADPYFENVTLLLPGNGTNGAQNNTFLDSSTNNFTITRNGNTTQGTFTPFSKADGRWSNYFDGTGDYLTVSDSNLAPGTGDFTIEMWVYATATPTDDGIFESRSNGTGTAGFTIGAFDGTTIRIYSGSALITASSISYVNTWCHVAVVKASGTTTLYINGVSKGTTTSIGNQTDTSWAIGGGRYGGTTTPDAVFSGYISGFRYVKGTAVYTTAFTPPTAPLTAITNTSLLTCQSNRFIDNSTNAFAITRNGDVSVQTFSPFPTLTAYAAGTNGGSGYFDGTGDYLTVADSATLEPSSSDFTIECWIYPTATGSFLGLFSKRTNNATDYSPIQILINSGTMLLLASTTGSSWAVNTNASTSPPLNAWSHIAVVRNGTASNNLVLYLNGVSVATGSVSNTALVNNSGAWAIAADSDDGSGNFAGYISGFRYVLGSAVYTSGFTPPTAPLTAITNTQLLLNFTNGGIIDTSMSNDLETVGNAQISTTQSKFGGSSMSFDGSGDNLVIPNSAVHNFGSENLTIEMWIYTSASGQYVTLMSKSPSSFASGMWALQINGATSSSGNLVLYVADNSNSVPLISTSGKSVIDNSWHHIAVVRNGSSWVIYIDGTSYGTATWSGSIATLSAQIWIGADQTYGRNYTGYIDDLRITKGYARYTANFTAPISPFNGFGD